MSSLAEIPLLVPFAEARADAEPVEVPMRDGIRLHADVYLPAAARRGRRVPSVLVRAPYGVREDFMLMPEIARYLTEHGLAAVVQDVRGKFRSGGAREPFLHEVLDGYDTLDWLVAQPWSDGSVGMYGESYYGFTQWAAAASGHPALKAMVPIVTGSCLPAWYARPGVVPFLAAPVGWFAGSWNAESIFLREEAEILDFGIAPVLDILGPGFEHARALVSDLVVAPSADLIGRTYPQGPPAPRVSIPVLHRGGWWDNIKGPQLDDWYAVQQAPARSSQFLEMAAMDHYSEQFSLSEVSDGDTGSAADAVERVAASATAFLEHHLGVRETAPRAPVRAEIANAGWVELEAWPPVASRATWHLDDAAAAVASADGGVLRPVGPGRTTTASWSHDPEDLVPSLTVSDFHVLPSLPDESEVHARSDVATFTSAPLAADLDLLGDVGAVLEVRATCPALPLIVALHHVREDRATVITEGSASAFVGGGWATVPVDLGAAGYRVPRGDRIRISVSASRFPRFLPPSGTVGSDWLASQRLPFDIALRVGGASCLILPILAPGASP